MPATHRVRLRIVDAPEPDEAMTAEDGGPYEPTMQDMIEMLRSPGRLCDHPLWPVLRRRRAWEDGQRKPWLRAIRGGHDAA